MNVQQRKRKSLEERFWEKVNKDGPIPEHRPELGPCWVWTGYCAKGYGRFGLDGKQRRATHVSYQLAYGHAIPVGEIICHACDNPSCVRPDHFFTGTDQDNIADRHAKARDAKGERHGSRTKPERLARGSQNGQAKLTESDVAEIRRRYAAGAIFTPQLAKEYGVSAVLIGKVLRGELWTHADGAETVVRHLRGVTGVSHPLSKFTEEQVREIRVRCVTTSVTRLGEEYGVSESTIRRIKTGAAYRSVAS